ncbi:hypothetical protein SELMODRAFT_417737 [Selaginella moellendorffii]|uniref:Uncharacterized protein n=1 Tax=Selaginella moellendorffii TaxID=88036 RepID=D8S3F9_SELML|nr:hypothetical protein SELMODRAFT_417737 [Selaginella moellendorffii]
MASLDLRWFRLHCRTIFGMRLPLYNGKLDLLAISRCFELNPAKLSFRVMVRQYEADNEDDDEYDVSFHPLPLDHTTGLSCLTWEEMVADVLAVYPISSVADAKTRQHAAVIHGPPLQSSPAWLSRLSRICRALVPVESVLCHQFMFMLHKELGVTGFVHKVSRDKKLSELTRHEPEPEEEDSYVDRHLPREQSDELLRDISNLKVPHAYRWLQPQEIDGGMRTLRVQSVNLDVEVRTKSSAVLACGKSGDAVLGIDVVSHFSQLSLRRCEVEFYSWASASRLPFVQFITDFRNGAVLFYCTFTQTRAMCRETMSTGTMMKLLQLVMATLPNPELELEWWPLAWKRFSQTDGTKEQ